MSLFLTGSDVFFVCIGLWWVYNGPTEYA